MRGISRHINMRLNFFCLFLLGGFLLFLLVFYRQVRARSYNSVHRCLLFGASPNSYYLAIIMRHGESMTNASGDCNIAYHLDNFVPGQGDWTSTAFRDPPLTGLGKQQAISAGMCVRSYMGENTPLLVFSSFLTRAMQTGFLASQAFTNDNSSVDKIPPVYVVRYINEVDPQEELPPPGKVTSRPYQPDMQRHNMIEGKHVTDCPKDGAVTAVLQPLNSNGEYDLPLQPDAVQRLRWLTPPLNTTNPEPPQYTPPGLGQTMLSEYPKDIYPIPQDPDWNSFLGFLTDTFNMTISPYSMSYLDPRRPILIATHGDFMKTQLGITGTDVNTRTVLVALEYTRPNNIYEFVKQKPRVLESVISKALKCENAPASPDDYMPPTSPPVKKDDDFQQRLMKLLGSHCSTKEYTPHSPDCSIKDADNNDITVACYQNKCTV